MKKHRIKRYLRKVLVGMPPDAVEAMREAETQHDLALRLPEGQAKLQAIQRSTEASKRAARLIRQHQERQRGAR